MSQRNLQCARSVDQLSLRPVLETCYRSLSDRAGPEAPKVCLVGYSWKTFCTRPFLVVLTRLFFAIGNLMDGANVWSARQCVYPVAAVLSSDLVVLRRFLCHRRTNRKQNPHEFHPKQRAEQIPTCDFRTFWEERDSRSHYLRTTSRPLICVGTKIRRKIT